jgi:oxygen-independent coproporphyrinogen-3 oxidase
LAGIYLHIPFCKQACTYCNFHFSTSLQYKDGVVKAIADELIAEKDYLGGERIDTVYFGGGTPSLLSIADTEFLMNTIAAHYSLSDHPEVTLESNPDDISAESTKAWRDAGINRLSIGVQSFFEEELRWMNRAHDATQALSGVQLALERFDNITIDLIYGSPLLTDEMWKLNVEVATGLGINHLSCYALTVEEKTPLYQLIRKSNAEDVDADKQARQFLLLMQWLREKGYEHYEVSNFAKPGFRSLHNSSYWRGEKYLGVGPSAHSFNGRERRWNVANNNKYIRNINEGNMLREFELLTDAQQLNEYIMISLRTKEGMDLERIEKHWGSVHRKRVEQQLPGFEKRGLIRNVDSIVQLTDRGMLLADGLSADLFVDASAFNEMHHEQ